MRNYLNIIRILFIDIFRRREKKLIALYVFLGLVYVGITAGIVYMMRAIAPTFKDAGKQSELITALLFGDFVMTIILGLIALISFLYLSKDNEFFLNLPIKPQTVFLAKLSMVYFTEVAVSIGLLLPPLLTLGITMSLPWLYFVLIPVIILAVPLFALVFIAIISMPIVYFITLFRNRGAVTTAIVITLFSALMAAYFYVAFLGSNSGAGHADPNEVIDYTPIFNTMTTLSKAFYPLYMLVKLSIFSPLGSLSLGLSMLLELVIFLSAMVATATVSYIIALMFYRRVNSRVLERSTGKSKNGSFSETNPLKSFLKKEFREVLRDPAVALQALAGIILCPLIVLFISISMANSIGSVEGMESVAGALFWSFGSMMLFSVGIGSNAGANFCISREGANFHYLKIVPVPYSTQIKAKQIMYVLCGFCSTFLAIVGLSVVSIILGIFTWWIPPILLIGVFSWIYAMVSISIFMDLRSPRLDYKNIKEIIRRGKNIASAMIWTFGSIIFSSIILVCSMIYMERSMEILTMGLLVYAIFGPMCAVLFHKKLYNNADSLFEKISV